MNESIQPKKPLQQVAWNYREEANNTEEQAIELTNNELAIILNALISRYNESLGKSGVLDAFKLSSIIKLSNALSVEINLK